ncbi:MAG: sugar phosphorylase [Anaerolineae bacterium]|nr:sugar phosphorylase [Anaerolineae bacterium]
MIKQYENDIGEALTFLYGAGRAEGIERRLADMLEDFSARHPGLAEKQIALTERDAMLITYGDMVSQVGQPPLHALADFLSARVEGIISSVHLLPFYPYSSDDGFSVVDTRQVDPHLGSWEDIRRFKHRFHLMVDGVINHISAQSGWFQGFLRDDPAFAGWFITVDGSPDLSQVARPRSLPLLSHFDTPSGEKAVWTTFSDDQIDLNYSNPDVLLAIIDLLLFYVAQGADFIRLDAIAYLWKEIGTPCIHLPQTHRVVQLLRSILDKVAPCVKLITETNVPHQDNISYFGDGRNEAQLVYNFALPPLVLHAIHQGTARVLTEWAGELSLPSEQVTFFNFLASHDGIGLNPARGILPESEIEALVARCISHGGLVSRKTNPDGSQSPYEINISAFDALSDPHSEEPLSVQVDRFMVSQAIMLAVIGVPGIYFHSLFGSRGWPEGVEITGRARTVNRQKLERAELEHELGRTGSLRRLVFDRYAGLLRARASSPAFNPYGLQSIFDCGEAVFALLRRSPTEDEQVLCLHNVSDREQIARLPKAGNGWIDLFNGQRWAGGQDIELGAYQVSWLRLRRGMGDGD